jgi:Na+/H+-dicarboxylate symporter
MAALFVAQALNIDLTLTQQITLLAVACLPPGGLADSAQLLLEGHREQQ